jgi:hypothetical protein
VLGDDRAQGLMARYADAPVVLTGPQAAAGLVQRLAGKTVGFDIETHGAFIIGADSGARSVRPLRRRECRDSRDQFPLL